MILFFLARPFSVWDSSSEIFEVKRLLRFFWQRVENLFTDAKFRKDHIEKIFGIDLSGQFFHRFKRDAKVRRHKFQ